MTVLRECEKGLFKGGKKERFPSPALYFDRGRFVVMKFFMVCILREALSSTCHTAMRKDGGNPYCFY